MTSPRSPRSPHSPGSVDSRNPTPLSTLSTKQAIWQILPAVSLVWGASFWLGACLLLAITPTEAAWAITLSALLALGSGWLQIEPERSGHHSAATWLEFISSWTLWLAKLTATASIALSLADQLLSQFQSVNAVWLLPVALMIIWGAVLGQRIKPEQPAFLWALALLSSVGLLGLLWTEMLKLATSLGLPTTPTILVQLPSSHAQLRLAELLQMTALLSVTFARFDNLVPSENWDLLHQTLRRKLVVIAVTLSWLLYFGLVMIRTLQSVDFGLAENLLTPLGKLLQGLALTPFWNIRLNVTAIAAFAGTIWLQIPSLDRHLRRLQVGVYDQRLAPTLIQLGIGLGLSGLLLVGDVKTLWAFSAFAALLHRALYHWQAVGYSQPGRWRSFSMMNRRQYLHGIAGAVSLMLAFWLDWQVWLVSFGFIALGLVWRGIRKWSETEE